MNFLFDKEWNDYVKSKNDILEKLSLDKIRRDEMLKIADIEIDEMRVKLANLYIKSLSYQSNIAHMRKKSQKNLKDFKDGKIAGVLV